MTLSMSSRKQRAENAELTTAISDLSENMTVMFAITMRLVTISKILLAMISYIKVLGPPPLSINWSYYFKSLRTF